MAPSAHDTMMAADLSTLLRINKGFPILVTSKGYELAVYQQALAQFFVQNPITWKRHGKYFPHPLSFPIKFVPFEERYVFSVDSTVEDLRNFAFLHVFFINASSADEYRTQVRHTVSEWFARLSPRPELQWIIVVDTTKAKERKNRSSLLEKIKLDFSKYNHKLIEVCDSPDNSSFTALTAAVQSCLFSHLDLLTETWERCLKSGRERYVAEDWNLVQCINQELEYARLFWSLGALDHALKLYEDLDSFVFFLVLSLSENKTTPPWACRLASTDIAHCPSLLESMRESQVPAGNDTIPGIRHLILAQKLLLTVHLFDKRSSSPRGNKASATTRGDVAAVLMKYSCNSLHGVIEHSILLQSRTSPCRLWVWTVQLVEEAFILSCLLADVTTVDAANDATCAMEVARFNAMLSLSSVVADGESAGRKELLEWVEGSTAHRGGTERRKLIKGQRESAMEWLHGSLSSPSAMETSLHSIHDSASSFLFQCGRKRTAAHLGYQFAQFLDSISKHSSALPFILAFVASLQESSDVTETLLSAIRSALPRLSPIDDYERLVRFRLFLSLRGKEKNRTEEVKHLLMQLVAGKEGGRAPIRLSEWSSGRECPIHARITEGPMRIEPGTTVQLSLHLSSSLPVDLPSSRVVVHLRRISIGSSSSSAEPAFQIELERCRLHLIIIDEDGLEGDEARLMCVHKGSTASRGSMGGMEDDEKMMILQVEEECTIKETPQSTVVAVSGVARESGLFAIHRVEVSVVEGAMSFVLPSSSLSSPDRPFSLLVQSTPHSIRIEKTTGLCAGVDEELWVVLGAGSTAVPSSSLRVESADGGDSPALEFASEDGLWESLSMVTVEGVGKEEQRRVPLQLCLPIEGDPPATITRKISLKWGGVTVVETLSFSPLFTVHLSTSHLENKMLVDLELSRATSPASSRNRRLFPLSASLSLKTDPPIEPSLLYFDLQPVSAEGVYSLIWSIPPQKRNLPLSPFRLRFSYGMSSDGERKQTREYEYRLSGEVEIKQVEFEICSQVLSQQPGAQLCRVGTACHLLVSIRSLWPQPETEPLLLHVSADDSLWELQERTKTFSLKESGLGQVSVVATPLVAGFLPFPSVQLFPSPVTLRGEDRFWSEPAEFALGAPLLTFERTAGKQIRVLGSSQGEGSINSRGEKKTIKEKLQKLFD